MIKFKSLLLKRLACHKLNYELSLGVFRCLVCFSVFFCTWGATQAEVRYKTDSVEAFITNQQQEIYDKYYFKNLNTTLLHYEQLITLIEIEKLWHKKLETIVWMAWCAEYYQEVELVDKLLTRGANVLSVHKATIDSLDADGRIRSDFNLSYGMYYMLLNDYEKAIDEFSKVVFKEGKHKPVDASLAYDCHAYIGFCYEQLENYSQAIEHYSLAAQYIPLLDSMENQMSRQALNLTNLGTCYFNMAKYQNDTARFDDAKKMYRKALGLYESGPDEKKLRDIQRLSATYGYLGDLYSSLKVYDSAEYYLRKSLNILGVNDPKQQSIYVSFGDNYLSAGEYQKAINHFIRSQNPIYSGNKKFNKHRAKISGKMGKVHATKEDWSKSLAYFQRGLGYAVEGFTDTLNVFKNPDIDGNIEALELLNLLYLKANSLRKSFLESGAERELTVSLETYELAVKLIDRLRLRFTPLEYKQYLSLMSSPLFENAIDAAWDAYSQFNDKELYLKKAFFFMEKSKSATLLEAVKNPSNIYFAGIPIEIQDREKTLKGEISLMQRLVDKEKRSAKRRSFKKKLLEKQVEYDELINRIRDQYPNYYQLKYNINPIELSDLKSILSSPKTALIEYFFGEDHIYVLGINSTEFSLKKVKADSSFKASLKKLVLNLNNYSPDSDQLVEYQDFVSSSHALYTYLIQPVIFDIGRNVKKLWIIPDGPLGQLPFDVLLTQPVENSQRVNYRLLPYLINQHSVSYEYSASLLSERKIIKGISKEYAYTGFAPVYDGDNDAVEGDANENEALSMLMHNQEEVIRASAFFHGRPFLGEEATESAFKEYANRSGIIHLSMHTLLNNKKPVYSKLMFSKPTLNEGLKAEASVGEEDGFLYLYELYNMKLEAELAILSACQTETGELAKGEGIISLGRAFRYAGCPNIVTSLWKANDKTTSEIMGLFFEKLHRGMEKDEALRMAKRTYLSKSSKYLKHPSYWAPFILVGDSKPVSLPDSPDRPILFWGGIIFFLVFTGMIYFYFKPYPQEENMTFQ